MTSRSKCVAMTAPKKGEPKQCPRSGTVILDGLPYCTQHAESVGDKIAAERKRREKQDQLNAEIDRYLEWKKDHPSIHEVYPRD